MAFHILLTENSVGTYSTIPTRQAREKVLFAAMWTRAASRLSNFVYSGLDLSSVSGRDVQITAGWAVVGGAMIYSDAAATITAPASTANRVWLQVTLDTDDLVSGARFTTTSDDTPPTVGPGYGNSVLIGRAPMGASAPTGATDPIISSLKCPGHNTTSYAGDGTSDRFIFLGAAPKRVVVDSVWGASLDQWVRGESGTTTGGNAIGLYSARISGVGTDANLKQTRSYRPELTTLGFYISGGLNSSGQTYNVVADF